MTVFSETANPVRAYFCAQAERVLRSISSVTLHFTFISLPSTSDLALTTSLFNTGDFLRAPHIRARDLRCPKSIVLEVVVAKVRSEVRANSRRLVWLKGAA